MRSLDISPGEAADINHQLDGCRLHTGWPGGQKGGVEVWVTFSLPIILLLLLLTLGVEEKDGPGVSELRQGLQHLDSGHGGELVNPGVDEETLEARHSHLHHLSQVRGVACSDLFLRQYFQIFPDYIKKW